MLDAADIKSCAAGTPNICRPSSATSVKTTRGRHRDRAGIRRRAGVAGGNHLPVVLGDFVAVGFVEILLAAITPIGPQPYGMLISRRHHIIPTLCGHAVSDSVNSTLGSPNALCEIRPDRMRSRFGNG